MATSANKRSFPAIKPYINTGKAITNPTAYLPVKEAIKRYQGVPLENTASVFYEEQGMPIPDFTMMSKIEKLEALNEFREKAKQLQDQITDIEVNNEKVLAAIRKQGSEKPVTKSNNDNVKTGTSNAGGNAGKD